MTSLEHLLGILFAYFLLYLLIRYAVRDSGNTGHDDSDTPPATTPRSRRSAAVKTEPHDSGSPSTVVCHNCRTENDPEYIYCKNCIADLSRL